MAMNGLLPVNEFFSVKNLSPAYKTENTDTKATSFGDLLGGLIDATNQTEALDQLSSFDIANANVEDLHNSMIAAVKAENALRLTLQVRNKCVEAYQEVMRMQV